METPTESEPIDALEYARHFAAHAARALHVLLVSAPPGRDRERDSDLFALGHAVLVALYPRAAVQAARADAIEVAGLHAKVELDGGDVLVVMALMIELLTGQARTASGPGAGVRTIGGREH